MARHKMFSRGESGSELAAANSAARGLEEAVPVSSQWPGAARRDRPIEVIKLEKH